MKFVSSVFVAIMAATTAQAAAVKDASACELPGEICYMLKRSADNSAEFKRSANALAEAMADAAPEAQTTEKWCHLPGQPCYKFKRATDAVGEAKRSADALAEAMA